MAQEAEFKWGGIKESALPQTALMGEVGEAARYFWDVVRPPMRITVRPEGEEIEPEGNDALAIARKQWEVLLQVWLQLRLSKG